MDVFKTAPFPEHLQATEGLPRYVHFPFDAGAATQPLTLDEAEKWLEATGTTLVNTHMNARAADFGGKTGGSLQEAVRDRFMRHLTWLSDRFGAARVVAENVVYRGDAGPFARCCVEPGFVTRLLEDAGVGLLLDTAHASLTCQETGETVGDYIRALPLGRLREWHVTGTGRDGEGKLRDSMPMTAADWAVASEVVALVREGRASRPVAVALEYGGTGELFAWRSDPGVIEDEVGRLAALLCTVAA